MARKKYLVLRNCFTSECVYYKKGQVVELSEALFKDEKNFRLVGEPEPVPEPIPEPEVTPEPLEETPHIEDLSDVVSPSAEAESEPEPIPELVPEPPPVATETPTKPVEEVASTIPPDEGKGFGDYLCPKCKVTHRAGSKIHKSHLKLLKG